MATFEQAIELWKKEEARRENLRLEEDANALAERQQYVKEQLEKIELIPLLIEDNHAYFQFQGEEIDLFIHRWKYGACGFYRVLGKCKICGNQTWTDEYELTLENIGYAVSDPQKAYHECWVAPQDKPIVKTTEEVIVESLKDLILETISRIQATSNYED